MVYYRKSNDLLVQMQLLADLSLGPGGEFGQILQSLSKSRQLNAHHTQLINVMDDEGAPEGKDIADWTQLIVLKCQTPKSNMIPC